MRPVARFLILRLRSESSQFFDSLTYFSHNTGVVCCSIDTSISSKSHTSFYSLLNVAHETVCAVFEWTNLNRKFHVILSCTLKLVHPGQHRCSCTQILRIQQARTYSTDLSHILIFYMFNWEQAVAQLVEALRYKPEGHGSNSRWCHWNFSLT